MEVNIVHNEDCLLGLKKLPDNCIDCCVTSPPYYMMRDYNVDGQIGLEETPQAYIDRLTEVFMEVYRVLKTEGTLWLNIGDTYWGGGWRNADFNKNSGSLQKGSKGTHCGSSLLPLKGNFEGYKNKDLIGTPWMLAFALRNAGWYLRQDIIWFKPNPMPESVTDRCTRSHEYIFLFSKSQKYYFNNEAIQERAVTQKVGKHPMGGTKYGEQDDRLYRKYSGEDWQPRTKNVVFDGQTPNTMHVRREMGLPDKEYIVRNKRDVWSVNVKGDTVAHFATYPEELIRPCILAGCPKGGVVLDPFMGSGTTASVALKLDRNYVGFELNPEYIKIITKKIQVQKELFT